MNSLPNTWFVKIQQVTLRGTPDFLLCVHGVFVALELKSSSAEKPTELQAYNLAKIAKAKGLALLVHPENWNEVYSCLHKVAQSGKIPSIKDSANIAEA